MRVLPALALTVVLAAGLGACGSDGSAPPVAGATTATDLVDICAVVSADDVASIVGAPVTVTDAPGGGCSFPQDDPTAPVVALTTSAYDDAPGGLEATREGLASVFTGGDPEPLEGVGRGAFVIVGTARGGDDIQGAGAVRLGSTVVVVTVVQGRGLAADAVRAVLSDTLELVATKG